MRVLIRYMLVILPIGFYFYFKASDLSGWLLFGFIFSWIEILYFSKYGTSNPNCIAKKFDEVQDGLK